VVVHGGGATITDWLNRHQIPTRFQRGLRVTDAETLRVVVAVLAGLVNKELVAALQGRGGRAFGLSGADGGLLRAHPMDESLGYVGQITQVDPRPLLELLDDGFIPVVAPIALWWDDEPRGHLLNVNADTVAGAIARALAARWLVFLTDVPGIRGGDGGILPRLGAEEARALTEAGIIEGGMIPKVEACLEASAAGVAAVITDGRLPSALLSVFGQQPVGTWIG
jgi:acetylglutamate kinase